MKNAGISLFQRRYTRRTGRQRGNRTVRQQDNILLSLETAAEILRKSSFLSRKQASRTRRRQGNETRRRQDNRTTEQEDIEEYPCNCDSIPAERGDTRTCRRHCNGTPEQRDIKTTGQQDNKMIITMANGKGGVGKTLVSLILASALKKSGASVSLSDRDPQRSASGAAEAFELELGEGGDIVIVDTAPWLDHEPTQAGIRDADTIAKRLRQDGTFDKNDWRHSRRSR